MRDLTFDEFSLAWSTYWGRREIGLVVDNAVAMRIDGRTQSLHGYHEQWRAARACFPSEAPLWLMGTPDLTPELFSRQTSDQVAPPPMPQIGRYVMDNSAVQGLANTAGDYTLVLPRNSIEARTARRLARGHWGVMVSLASLVVVWLPFLAASLAVLGLVWTAQADGVLRRVHAPWRIRWPIVAGQLIAIVSILLAVFLALTSYTPTPSNA